MNFQWYPGHMTKAKRQMQEDIKLIDLVIELVDARIPLSSRNPDIDELGKNKYRLILMNKADLADRKATEQWSAFFKKKGYYVVSLDARSKNGMKSITDIIMEACKEKMERDRKRGIKNRIYQFVCGKSVCKDRKQAGCNEGKTVDTSEQKCRAFGYSGNSLAEI